MWPVSRIRRNWSPAPEDGAFLAQRARTHLSYRLAGRAIQIVLSAGSDRPRRRVAGALAWAVTDVVGGTALRRSSRFALVPRLAVDVADIIAWGGRGADCDLAAISGLPLAVESGIRLGPLGVVVPAVGAAVTGAVRRHRGLPMSVASFRWQVIGVAVGTGFAAYGRNRRQVVLARHRHELEARLHKAYVSGENDVAMGADSVVDLLSRTTPLLPPGSGDSVVGRLLASWKESLAADTLAVSTYLGVTLTRWERRHNATHHALDADVAFVLQPGDGTVLLSGAQARWLEGVLDSTTLRGRVTVAVVDPDEAGRPTTPRRLLVGGELVVVPADRVRGLTPVDIGPSGFVIGAIWALDTISSGDSGSSPWAVGPVVAGGMLLAAWAHRQVDRHGQDAHPRILAAGVAMALAQAVAGTATMTRTRASNGMQRHPYLAGVDMMGVLVSLYADEFSVLLAAGVGAGVVATIGLGVLLMPEPVDWAHLVCDLLWSAAAALAISGLRSGLDEDADRINAELARVDDANVNRAFADGRASVVSMVADAARRARRAFDASKGAMNPTVSTEVEHRFDEIRNRLIDLERDTGPACS
jgi:hypothetical protein